MATPPRITQTELAACLGRIVARRAKVDDPHRELLPDPDQAEPREMLDYLHTHPAGVRWVREADVVDALTLTAQLWWQDRRREYRTLTAGVREGLFLTQLGAPLGITSRAGVRDRMHRLQALLAYDRPDEKLTREARRVASASEAARAAEQAWIQQHHDALHAVAGELLAAAQQYHVDDRDWLDELATDLRDEALCPATMALLGLAGAEVATAPQVAALAEHPQPFAVHRTLRRLEQLRAHFADLGKPDNTSRRGVRAR